MVLEAHEKIDDFFKFSPILLEIIKTILTSQINSDLKEKLCSIPIQHIFDYLNSPDSNQLILLIILYIQNKRQQINSLAYNC